MGVLNDVGQKIKGKTQQFKGDQEIKHGNPIEGTVNKIKGKVNELDADVKLKSREQQAKDSY